MGGGDTMTITIRRLEKIETTAACGCGCTDC